MKSIDTISSTFRHSWWLIAVGTAAIISLDLIALYGPQLFHPALFPDHKPRYFRKLPRKDG